MKAKYKRMFDRARRHPSYFLEGLDIEFSERLFELRKQKVSARDSEYNKAIISAKIRELQYCMRLLRKECDAASKIKS